MAERLGITRVWLSMLENGSREVSELLRIKAERMESERVDGCVNPVDGRVPASGNGDKPLSRILGAGMLIMPTRADCEVYFQAYLDAAEADGEPENFPYVFRRLRQSLPLDEWKAMPAGQKASDKRPALAKRRRGD